MVKQFTTVSEFDLWQAYFERRLSEHDKQDWYHAATMRAIFASQGGPSSRLGPLSDYLLSFDFPKKDKKIAEQTQDSKAVWASIFGMDFA